MINAFHLHELISELEGRVIGNDVIFNSVSIDTRTLTANDLFIAIRGENFDGNEFVAEAMRKGACAAIVSRKSDAAIAQLLVKDTSIALGILGRMNRRESTAKVFGITGSQGKTTVKEMTGKICARIAKTLVTQGNLNNQIGVPLTLLALEADHKFAVIEMGASGLGEIAYTGALVEPDISILTNASNAHIEGFGSLQGVVQTKGEIIDAAKANGVVVLNADDIHVDEWKRRAGPKKTVTFSIKNSNAEYYASNLSSANKGMATFALKTPAGSAAVRLSLPGNHNIANAVAAAAATMEAGATLEQVVSGLSDVVPVKGRMCLRSGFGNSHLIDDSYNASPSSFRAAIDVLADYPGNRVLVMGDMAELGGETEAAHREVGVYAAKKGIDYFLALGRHSALAAEAFGRGGEKFNNKQALLEKCKLMMNSPITMLIKGSRSAGMEFLVDELTEKEAT